MELDPVLRRIAQDDEDAKRDYMELRRSIDPRRLRDWLVYHGVAAQGPQRFSDSALINHFLETPIGDPRDFHLTRRYEDLWKTDGADTLISQSGKWVPANDARSYQTKHTGFKRTQDNRTEPPVAKRPSPFHR